MRYKLGRWSQIVAESGAVLVAAIASVLLPGAYRNHVRRISTAQSYTHL